MQSGGTSGVNPIASPIYAQYLTPAVVFERARERLRAEEKRILVSYYSRPEDTGFPGLRIDLLA
ncbi:MAG TPA: hypothetical protein VMV44_13575 [Rectinemataceae bacterium]|nr:hypothetical protein [Rectinemataceae bacterium]